MIFIAHKITDIMFPLLFGFSSSRSRWGAWRGLDQIPQLEFVPVEAGVGVGDSVAGAR